MPLPEIPVAIVGYGKIARDQHVPAIGKSPAFRLAATVDGNNAGGKGVDHYGALSDLLRERPDIGTLILCTPPQVRFDLARAGLEAGRHVLLEKSPGSSLAEVRALESLAEQRQLTLFAAWHSRFAHAVADAKAWLADRRVKQAEVIWKEDVRYWHPGQRWIWKAGGLGVFDPGINALSVLTEILPEPAMLTGADLEFPENCETPIAARLGMRGASGFPITAVFDWRHTGEQVWDIRVETADGVLTLSDGGARLSVDGAVRAEGPDTEYDRVYARFAELIAEGRRDVDHAPLMLVADAFLLGRRLVVDPFLD